MGMKLEFIDKVLKTAFLFAFITFCFLWVFQDLSAGASVLAGAFWGILNLYVIKQLCHNILLEKYKEPLKLFFLFGIKCPVLYAIGFGLLKIKYFSFLYLVLGFSLLLASILLVGILSLITNSTEKDLKSYD